MTNLVRVMVGLAALILLMSLLLPQGGRIPMMLQFCTITLLLVATLSSPDVRRIKKNQTTDKSDTLWT